MIVRKTLAVLAADVLTDPGELFFCVPLECTLSASSCTRRQQEARRPKTLPGDAARFGTREHLRACVACPLGELVVSRVGPAPDRKPEQLSAVGRRRATKPKTQEFTIDDLFEVIVRVTKELGPDTVIEAVAAAVWPVTAWAREGKKVA
jgi:hypothetical protein